MLTCVYGVTNVWFFFVCVQEGKLATGILTPLAKNAGFSNVSDFLNKGTDDIAKCLQWKADDETKATELVTLQNYK